MRTGLMFCLALTVRLAVNAWITGFDITVFGDEKVFTALAYNLVSGNGYSVDGINPSALRPPGFPFLLAIVFSISGNSLIVARVFNLCLSALTVCVIYLLVLRLFGKKIALVAGLAAVFNPFFVIGVPVVLYSDAFYLLLLTIVLALFLKLQETNSPKLKVICGAIIGVAILTRSELVLFIPLIIAWTFFYYQKRRPALQASVLILLPVVLLVSPWLMRNYLVFGKVTMATNFGCTLWGVYNPNTFSDRALMGAWDLPKSPCLVIGDAKSLSPRYPGCDVLPETEVDKTCLTLAVTTIKQNYKQLPRLVAYKVRNLFSSGGAIENLFLLPIVYCFFFGLILLIASGERRFLILFTFLLFIIGSTVLFYTFGRLRMPFETMMIIIGSYGLYEQTELIKRRISEVRRSLPIGLEVTPGETNS